MKTSILFLLTAICLLSCKKHKIENARGSYVGKFNVDFYHRTLYDGMGGPAIDTNLNVEFYYNPGEILDANDESDNTYLSIRMKYQLYNGSSELLFALINENSLGYRGSGPFYKGTGGFNSRDNIDFEAKIHISHSYEEISIRGSRIK